MSPGNETALANAIADSLATWIPLIVLFSMIAAALATVTKGAGIFTSKRERSTATRTRKRSVPPQWRPVLEIGAISAVAIGVLVTLILSGTI